MDATTFYETLPSLEDRLVLQYGELIELSELVELLRYPSALALKRAVEKKALGFSLTRFGSSRVAATREVAKLLVAAGFPERPGSV